MNHMNIRGDTNENEKSKTIYANNPCTMYTAFCRTLDRPNSTCSIRPNTGCSRWDTYLETNKENEISKYSHPSGGQDTPNRFDQPAHYRNLSPSDAQHTDN